MSTGSLARVFATRCARYIGERRPNKRLKLTGGDRSKGRGVLFRGPRGPSSSTFAPASESPRSLSAIR